jgi:hypothetical protein
MQGTQIKEHNYGMIINKKLTNSDHFASRNFLNSGIMNMLLTDIFLRILLGRIWTILGPMTRLVAVLVGLVS